MITTYLNALHMFSRDVRLYLISAVLFGFTVFGGIYSLLLNLYVLRLGYGPELVGLMNGTGQLAFAVFSLPAGVLGGRWGSRRMLIAGLSLAATGYGLLPMSEFTPGSPAAWLLATNLLGNLGIALYLVNMNPFLTGATQPAERNHVYALQAALWPLAGFAGSLVGGLLPGLLATMVGIPVDQPAPYRYSLWIAALLLIPAVLALTTTGDISVESTPRARTDGEALPLVLIALLASSVLLRVAGEGAARVFFNVYLDAGLQVPTGQLLAVPAALVTPLLAARWGNGRTYYWATLGMAASLLPLALVPHWGAAGLSYMGMIALASITRPAIGVYQMELVSQAWRATMSGATTTALGLSWALMALGGGLVITTLGYRSFFLSGACLTAAGALLFWAYFRVPRGEFAARLAAQDQGT